MRAWGGGLGQRSAVSGLRGSGPPLALVAPVLPPTGGVARPSVALYRWGSVGRGGRPAARSPSHSLAPFVWADGAWPSPASPLVRGFGLWRWRVPPSVAPVGEGVAQGPGEEGRPSRLSVGPCCPNHRPEDPLLVLRGRPPPQGVPPGSPRLSGGARHRRAGSSSP